jgi:hypothetical protein
MANDSKEPENVAGAAESKEDGPAAPPQSAAGRVLLASLAASAAKRTARTAYTPEEKFQIGSGWKRTAAALTAP